MIVYVSSVEPGSGKSLVAFGIMDFAVGRTDRVAFFTPIIASGERRDPTIELMRHRFNLTQSYDESFGLVADPSWTAHEEPDPEMIQHIIAAFDRVSANRDLVVIEGTSLEGPSASFEFAFNAALAANLGASAAIVARADDRNPEQVFAALEAAAATYAEHHVPVLSFGINRVTPEQRPAFAALGGQIGEVPVWLIPYEPRLAHLALADVADAVDARVLAAGASGLGREVVGTVVAAMALPNLMSRLEPGSLVIVPGDRSEVILLALVSQFSSGVAPVSGLLLTGGVAPDAALMRFADGLHARSIPILITELPTMETIERLVHVSPTLANGDRQRLGVALGVFETAVDLPQLDERFGMTQSPTVTPLMFEQRIAVRARADVRRIVLPEGEDDRILVAAERVLRRGVADLTILGEPDRINERVAALGLDLSRVTLIDPSESAWLPEFTARLLDARRHKGMSETTASDLVRSPTWFATLMVDTGRADGMVSGACHTTADTVRPALQVIRSAPDVSTVSSVFFMALPDRVLVYGDCAVVPDPDSDELADIALSSARTAAAFGIDPRVAMLSYATGSSGSGVEVEKIARATELVRQRAPDLPVDGPIQYDAAVDPDVAARKLPDSRVAGRATVLVFPDLNTGNNTYKAVQRSAGAVAIGPILQGLRLPVNDLSRGATEHDIFNTIAITAVQAQQTPRGQP